MLHFSKDFPSHLLTGSVVATETVLASISAANGLICKPDQAGMAKAVVGGGEFESRLSAGELLSLCVCMCVCRREDAGFWGL